MVCGGVMWWFVILYDLKDVVYVGLCFNVFFWCYVNLISVILYIGLWFWYFFVFSFFCVLFYLCFLEVRSNYVVW